MAYQGIKVRRAAIQADIARFDAGDEHFAAGAVGSLTQKSPSEYRADLERRRDQLDRLIRLASGHA